MHADAGKRAREDDSFSNSFSSSRSGASPAVSPQKAAPPKLLGPLAPPLPRQSSRELSLPPQSGEMTTSSSAAPSTASFTAPCTAPFAAAVASEVMPPPPLAFAGAAFPACSGETMPPPPPPPLTRPLAGSDANPDMMDTRPVYSTSSMHTPGAASSSSWMPATDVRMAADVRMATDVTMEPADSSAGAACGANQGVGGPTLSSSESASSAYAAGTGTADPCIPGDDEIRECLQQMHALTRFRPGCLVVAMIYIERLRRSCGADLLVANWQPTLLAALILAQKVCERGLVCPLLVIASPPGASGAQAYRDLPATTSRQVWEDDGHRRHVGADYTKLNPVRDVEPLSALRPPPASSAPDLLIRAVMCAPPPPLQKLTKADLAQLERDFLQALDYNVGVKANVYTDWCVERATARPLPPLTNPDRSARFALPICSSNGACDRSRQVLQGVHARRA